MSVAHEKLMLLKNATVNSNFGFDDVCREKQVSIAYNNQHPTFLLQNEQMVEYPVQIWVRHRSIAYEWEIQAAFFANNNIKPKWRWANQDWGRLNYTTGQWSGACGMIQKDEAQAYFRIEYTCLDLARHI